MKYLRLIVLFVLILVISCLESMAQETLRIGLAGDVMLGRLVNELLQEKLPAYPWGTMLPFLQDNHLNLINLENAITVHNEAVPKVFNFKTDPANTAVLRVGNIHVVNLANNHILDFGTQGLQDTLKNLKQANIASVGAGMSIQEAQKPYIFTKNGISIGIVGFTDNEPTWNATQIKPGTNYVRVGDIETVKKTIQPLIGSVDYIIASIHWGPNMKERPSKGFQAFARQMIDAGISIIHGHSAHIFQGIEYYKNGLILYDTGDFVDDYRVDPVLRNNISFLFNIELSKSDIKSLKLIPTKIENMYVNRAENKEAQWAIKRMQELSHEFGFTINNQGEWFNIKKQSKKGRIDVRSLHLR